MRSEISNLKVAFICDASKTETITAEVTSNRGAAHLFARDPLAHKILISSPISLSSF